MPDQRRNACVNAAASEKPRQAEIWVNVILVSASSCFALSNRISVVTDRKFVPSALRRRLRVRLWTANRRATAWPDRGL